MADTSIAVSDEVWEELHRRKQRGDTFDDVLRDLLEMNEDTEEKNQRDQSPDMTPRVRNEIEQKTTTADLPQDIPQRIDDKDAADAIEAAVALIREKNGATMREIVQEVMPRHDLDYEVPQLEAGDRFRGAWWRRVVKPGLEKSENIEKPQKGGSEWTYIGKDNE